MIIYHDEGALFRFVISVHLIYVIQKPNNDTIQFTLI